MNKTVLWIIGGVVTVGLIILLAASIVTEEGADPTAAYGEVTISGEVLPMLPDTNADGAIGQTAPSVVGEDFDGSTVGIEPDGRPKIVIFLAHWCSHCQVEVPVIQQWLDEGNLPGEVDIYSITTLTDPRRQPFPPRDWLEGEGWTVPVIMDDESDSAAVAYGLRGTPMYMVLDGNNVNLGRISGEIGVGGLKALVGVALAGA